MPYCTEADVRAQVVTDLTPTQITGIIAEVDAMIAWKYSLVGVPALVIQRASRLNSAYQILIRDPNAQAIGEYSENKDEQMRQLLALAEDALSDLELGGTIQAFNEPID